MKYFILMASICSVFFLSGCSSKSYPVYGKAPKGERFTGDVTTSMFYGAGTMTVLSSANVKCTGKYVSDSWGANKVGNGNFKCDDGREGRFVFAGKIDSGHGFGTFTNGEEFDFYFGKAAIEKSTDK